MVIKAKFIGANSLGYENRQVYELVIKGMSVSRRDGTGKCIYESLESYLSNWDFIIILN